MRITLLGMSGIGKTYWAKQLEQVGFERFSVDDLIEVKLSKELSALGYEGIHNVAKWMGQPYEKQYPKTSEIYLDFERQSLIEVLSHLSGSLGVQNDVVIDTTGSVVYLPEEILQALSECTCMFYLHTPEVVHVEMARQYLLDPKPVIWGSSFSRASGETRKQAIARCYPELLRDRTEKYKRLAHITLDYTQLRGDNMDVQTIIDRVREVKV